MDNKALLGKRIKELRRRKGLTQEKLAETVGVEPASICNIENGYNYPSFQNLEKILAVLESSFVDVFMFEQCKEPNDLKAEIMRLLDLYPEKIPDIYKILKAIIL